MTQHGASRSRRSRSLDCDNCFDYVDGMLCAQAAFESALLAFAPGLGAGKYLNAAFARAWKAEAAAAAQTVG